MKDKIAYERALEFVKRYPETFPNAELWALNIATIMVDYLEDFVKSRGLL